MLPASLMRRIIVCYIVLISGLVISAQAHDLWVAKTTDGYAVARGHIPNRVDPYLSECVEVITAYGLDADNLPLNRVDEKERVVVQTLSDPALVAVVAPWGRRVIDEKGKKLFMTKGKALESNIKVKEAFFSTQFSKTLFGFNERFTKPLGMKFEVAPMVNPLALQAGDWLPIQVLFNGTPLARGKIERGRGSEPLETDENGAARVPVGDAKGWQKVLVVHDVPARERRDIEYYRFFTFLVFELK